jgi:predicted ribosomally synthesized peptide with SipW-like signal peptide
MNIRTMAAMGGVGLAGLGLMGAGAHATFTDSVHSTQTIGAGTLDVQLESHDGVVDPTGKTVTYAYAGPVGSTFNSGEHGADIVNKGDIAASAIVLTAGDRNDGSPASLALRNQLWVKVTSNDPVTGPNTVIDEPLTALEASGQAVAGTIAPGAKDQ